MTHQNKKQSRIIILVITAIVIILMATVIIVSQPKPETTRLYIVAENMDNLTLQVWYSNNQTGIKDLMVEEKTFHFNSEQYTTSHSFLLDGSEVILRFLNQQGTILGYYQYPNVTSETLHLEYSEGKVTQK